MAENTVNEKGPAAVKHGGARRKESLMLFYNHDLPHANNRRENWPATADDIAELRRTSHVPYPHFATDGSTFSSTEATT